MMLWQSGWWDEPKEPMHFGGMMQMMPEETPENKSISTLNFIRSFFYKTIDELNKKTFELNKYNLTEEVDCIKELIKDLWKQTEKINEVIRNKYPEIKEAQDLGRSTKEDNGEETPKECPECWEPMDGDTCSECWYTFKS